MIVSEMTRDAIAVMRILIIAAVVGALTAVTAVQAQGIGDIQQGHQLAVDACASCHAVGPSQTQSPVANVPSFQRIARTSGMTATALAVWLTAHPHPMMPLLVLSSQEVHDVSAYILSLRD
jgi:mono/diheme cytochrome c family protein